MDEKGGPHEPVNELDARRRERAGDDLDAAAEDSEAFHDDLREELGRERLRLEREEAERAARQAEARQGAGEDERPGWWLALEGSWRDHRAAFAEGDGPGWWTCTWTAGAAGGRSPVSSWWPRRWWRCMSVRLMGAVGAIVAGTYEVGRAGVEALVDLGVPHTIYRPVTAYLDGHCQGLPITAGQLAGLWLGARSRCWCSGSSDRGAPAWAGSPPALPPWRWCGQHHPARLPVDRRGVAVLAWSVLSIVAFHGAGRGRRLTIVSDAFDRRRPAPGKQRAVAAPRRGDRLGGRRGCAETIPAGRWAGQGAGGVCVLWWECAVAAGEARYR
ncbi:hypothetical protein ACFQY7_18020 [Actinomadura luteofluorescens]|uniref:hypothetical protein n=1 Tax=Actinomadura luteofluorescens TaxID=46163 RepID=UPI00362984D1